jgi:hypothetical protein
MRPTEDELAYVGFTELQMILIRDAPDEVAIDAYRLQLEMLMSDHDEVIDF